MMIQRPTIRVSRDAVRALIPTFVVELLSRYSLVGSSSPSLSSSPRSQKKLHATAYLDGLRGLASLAVFGSHFTDYNLKYFHPGWGMDEKNGSSFLQLPFVRLIYEGRPMVHLFFIISGFALSLSPLRELHAGRIEACHSKLASASIRRPIRLLGPCMLLTFLLIFCSRMGLFGHYINRQETFTGQVRDWAKDFFGRVAWVWSWEHHERPKYNVHLWTIAVELSHSYALFAALLLVSPLKQRLRPVAILGMMIYTLSCGRWAIFEFLGGCLLADMHLRNQRDENTDNSATLPGSGTRDVGAASRIMGLAGKFAAMLAAILSAYVLSWPWYEPFPSFYQYLMARAPAPFYNGKDMGWEIKADFWWALSAFAFVWAAGRLPLLKRSLEAGFPQYMGKISFAFYILQHPVLNYLQPKVMGEEPRAAHDNEPAVPGWGLRGWPGVETWTQRVMSWLIGWLFIGLIEMALAHVYTRYVDQACVRAARWVEGKVCIDKEAGGDEPRQIKGG